jgi:hypothetical protein
MGTRRLHAFSCDLMMDMPRAARSLIRGTNFSHVFSPVTLPDEADA